MVMSNNEGTRGGAVGSGTALKAGRSRVRLIFLIDFIFLTVLWHWVQLRLLQKEVPGISCVG